eukprot:Sspe_Gene.59560::Locus_32729_Transcript_3_3_Confidence_0.667_Length_3076::g.59560::m.59560
MFNIETSFITPHGKEYADDHSSGAEDALMQTIPAGRCGGPSPRSEEGGHSSPRRGSVDRSSGGYSSPRRGSTDRTLEGGYPRRGSIDGKTMGPVSPSDGSVSPLGRGRQPTPPLSSPTRSSGRRRSWDMDFGGRSESVTLIRDAAEKDRLLAELDAEALEESMENAASESQGGKESSDDTDDEEDGAPGDGYDSFASVADGESLFTMGSLKERVFSGTPSLPLLAQKVRNEHFKNFVVVLGPYASVGEQNRHYIDGKGVPNRPNPYLFSLERRKVTNPIVADLLASRGISSLEDALDRRLFKAHPEVLYTCWRELWPSPNKPLLAHHLCRLLNDRGELVRVYTENFDGLERAAGLPKAKLVEMEGTFNAAQCATCGREHMSTYVKERLSKGQKPSCTYKACSGLVKPSIVLRNDPKILANTECRDEDLEKCDCLLVIGYPLDRGPLMKVIEKVNCLAPRCFIVPGPQGDELEDPEENYRDVYMWGDVETNLVKFCKMAGMERWLLDSVPHALSKRLHLQFETFNFIGYAPSQPSNEDGILKHTVLRNGSPCSSASHWNKRRPLHNLYQRHAFDGGGRRDEKLRSPRKPLPAERAMLSRVCDFNQTLNVRVPRKKAPTTPLSRAPPPTRSSSAGAVQNPGPPPIVPQFKPLSAPSQTLEECRSHRVRFSERMVYIHEDDTCTVVETRLEGEEWDQIGDEPSTPTSSIPSPTRFDHPGVLSPHSADANAKPSSSSSSSASSPPSSATPQRKPAPLSPCLLQRRMLEAVESQWSDTETNSPYPVPLLNRRDVQNGSPRRPLVSPPCAPASRRSSHGSVLEELKNLPCETFSPQATLPQGASFTSTDAALEPYSGLFSPDLGPMKRSDSAPTLAPLTNKTASVRRASSEDISSKAVRWPPPHITMDSKMLGGSPSKAAAAALLMPITKQLVQQTKRRTNSDPHLPTSKQSPTSPKTLSSRTVSG